MSDFFTAKPCSGTVATAVTPKKEMKIDLLKIADKFDKVLARTPLVLVVEVQNTECSVHPTAKLLIKSRDTAVVNKIANEIYKLIL